MEMNDRKVGLVTGGGTGTGKGIALALARKDINVVINYLHSKQDAEQTAAEVEKLGVSCLLQQADVSNDEQVRLMIENTIQSFGRLDFLVNNAGTTVFVDHADLEGLKPEHWDKIMNTNVKGVFLVSRAASSYLRKANGSIVNITSVAGITGLGSSIAYGASKAAAISVTKSLALVLAPEVRVNSVAPGIILTRWVEGREEHIRQFNQNVPLGRVCTVEDVVEVVIPLLTSAAMVTGQTVLVDGGWILKRNEAHNH
jgi:3-oxoacyl-[acyl-carrier protein] reductase